MNLSGIIAISGTPGLHKIIARSKTGIIVESVIDKKRNAIQSTDRVSALEDISMFTTEEDIKLIDVIKKVYEHTKGAATPVTHKSTENEIRNYFKEVLPNYDEERVYVSNIKKLIEWYNLLLNANLLNTTEETDDEAKIDVKALKTETKNLSTSTAKTSAPKVNSKSSGGVKVTTRKSGSA